MVTKENLEDLASDDYSRKHYREQYSSFYRSEGLQPGGCWTWLRNAANNEGRAFLKYHAGSINAARFFYAIYRGSLKGLQALHLCHNVLCVNPNHLYLGTPLDNMRDKYKEGREGILVGQDHPGSKLDNTKVLEIRRRLISGERQVDLAREFKVTRTCINDIKSRKRWGHV